MQFSRTIRTAAFPVLLSIVGSAVVATGATPAVAAPKPTTQTAAADAPRTGADPQLLFVEDFEHGVGTSPVLLDDYEGEAGETYTADPAWISAAQCNGIITSAASSDVPACPSNRELRALADVLGRVTGEDPGTNHVVSAWTSSRDLPANAVQAESEQPFALGRSGRYVSFGVSAAAGACVGFTHPLLDFLLVDGTTERPVSSRPLDPCTDPRSATYTVGGADYRGGEYVSSGGVLFSGDELRWRLRNKQSSSSGNDGAIDRVTIVDSTPTVQQEFDGSPIIGDTVRMTLRVVNTSEHGSKPGWSFDASLPAGLTIAEDAALQTTCAASTTDIAADRGSIAVAGDLAIDAADCAVSFDVVAAAPGEYTAGASGVSDVVGLDVGAGDSVTFAPERNTLAVSERAVLSGGNGDAVADLDEQVAFVTTVRNDGNVLVRDLEVTGTAGAVTCAAGELAPGRSTECTSAPRAVTQADLDAGSVTDSVRVSGTSRLGQAVSAAGQASVPTTSAAARAVLELEAVTADAPGVGDEIGLETRVRNTGNVSVRDLTVTLGDGFTIDCPAGALAPGASIECDVDGVHTVTQADVDRGSVTFSGSLAATGANGAAVSAADTTSVATEARAAAIGVEARASVSASGRTPTPGDPVAVTVTVRNTGNVTVDGVRASVQDLDGMPVDCPAGQLAPGASTDCSVPAHRLTQQDIDAGTVSFRVVATASDPTGAGVDAQDTATVTVDGADAVVVSVTAALAGEPGARPTAGAHVELSATVRNDGTTTLRDPVLDVDGPDTRATCPAGALAPAAAVACTVTDHELTQQEIDHGSVTFAAAVQADAPGGRTVRASDEAEVALARVAEIATSATSVLDTSEHEVPVAGDTARVVTRVENTGNVTVDGLRVAVTGRPELSVDCATDALAPGASTTCAATGAALVQSDIDAGGVEFAVRAAATGADRQRAESSTSTSLSIVRAPAVSTTAAVVTATEGAPHAGDRFRVTAVLRNQGNVTLSDLGASASRTGGDPVALLECDGDVLAPGAELTCVLPGAELTQADIDAGVLRIDVAGSATGAGGRAVSDSDRAETSIERAPAVTATLGAHHASEGDGAPIAGDRIALTLSVRNAGNTTLTGLRGELVELPDAGVSCPAEPMAPGAEAACEVPEHVISQSELERGFVSFVAVVDGDGPDGATAAARDEVRVGLDARSGLDVTGAIVVDDAGAGPRLLRDDDVVHPGDRLAVRFTVRNTGNLTIDDLQAVPGMVDATVEAARLEPGARTTAASATHVVSEDEAASGAVVLVSQLRGAVTRPDGAGATADDGATTGQTGALSTARTAVAPAPDVADQVVTDRPVWVFSERVRSVAKAQIVPKAPELAFTGSEALVAVPVAVLLVLAGLVLAFLRRRGPQRGRHRN